ISPRTAAATLLNGLERERIRRACERFTPESTALVQEPVSWSGQSPAACTYLKCLRDRGVMTPRHQDRMAANLGPKVEVVRLDCCHYAMLERPAEVAAILNGIARKAGLSAA